MAIGLHKKKKQKKQADLIISGGAIYTEDPERPTATAIAVKNGVITAVGTKEEVYEFKGPSTEIEDISGYYLTPGFIALDENCGNEFIKDILTNDEPEGDAPPAEICGEAEETENIIMGSDKAEENHKKIASKYISKGITSVLSTEKNESEGVYASVLAEKFTEKALSFRYFGSTVLTTPADIKMLLYFLRERRIACTELDGFIDESFVDIILSENEKTGEFKGISYLKKLCDELGSHGWSLRITAHGKKATLAALESMGEISENYPKISFILRHGEVLSEEELGEVYSGTVTIEPSFGKRPFAGPGAELERRTALAARILGRAKDLGGIMEGKAADFALFSEDPLSANTEEAFENLKARATYLAGVKHIALD